MSGQDTDARLVALREEHREIDLEIARRSAEVGGDMIALARLKRQKLRLRDEIELLADMMVPDIIA